MDALPSVLGVALALIAVYASSFIYCFIRNFFDARKTGFPSVIVPWDQNGFLWMVISVPFRPYLQKWLPKPIYDRIVLCIYGWEFHERLRPFEEYSGPRGNDKSFMLVTCGKSEFWTRDPEIAAQILGRPRDFQQVDITDLFMAKFGHNILTSNGDRWARQRKVVASVINERISKAVFNESIRQTEGLLAEVNRKSDDKRNVAETNRLFDMVKKITIHVLSGAGMGSSVSWNDDANEKPKPGYKLTYIEAVKIVINNISGPLILPQWFLSSYPSYLPGYQNLKSLSYAVKEFPTHTADMLDRERQRSSDSKTTDSRNNIMSQLLQASEDNNGKGGKTLTDEEIMGNLFVFTAAGFDTTANSLAYALTLLARYPKWQDWLLEEIDSILPADTPSDDLDYATVFPKATRMLAFMYETLRLYTPLVHVTKQTRTAQTLQTSAGFYWLPAKTTTYVNTVALGIDPAVWRNLNVQEHESKTEDDELRFRPTRWLNQNEDGQHKMYQPPKGQYLTWSAGPRVCPGQKMAQVEFTAVILALLRRHRIDIVPLAGEDTAQIDSRVDAMMKKSTSILTLQMDGVYDTVEGSGQGLKIRLSSRK